MYICIYIYIFTYIYIYIYIYNMYTFIYSSSFIAAKFAVGVSSQPAGTDDVSSFLEVPAAASSHCVDGLTLQHGATYYVIVVAFNTAGKSSKAYSDGGSRLLL